MNTLFIISKSAAAVGFICAAVMGFLHNDMTAVSTGTAGVVAIIGSFVKTPSVPVSIFALFFLVSGTSFATPISTSFISGMAPIIAPENDFILAPIGSIEFNPETKDNYGLAFTECISYSKVLPGADENHVLISPYFFLGIFGAFNVGKWIDSSGGAPWEFDYGPIVGLPKLDDTLPEVAFSFNLRTNQFMINAAFPVDLLPSFLVHKL